jgi:hypothetical protein
MQLERPDGKVTHPDAHGLSHAYMAMRIRTGTPQVLKTLAASSQAYPTRFSLKILSFSALLSWVSKKSRLILSSCAYFSPFQVFFFSILFILFSVLLTVRILTLLGICFENTNCIFVISAV